MNAVIDRAPAVTVALLGPADAAREQLRQALLGLGAELVFEGEVKDGARLTGQAPQVLIVNLEPGVEDELDALQDLLESPDTAVVFNEGEVSSQLTGWDLARWARHLAAKVLGVRDTLPPPPSGAERLPELTLLPEPGRPVSPSQQQDHLKFDAYAEEALGHSGEVPTSPRLDLQPESELQPEPQGTALELSGLDFDFSPVHPSEPAEATPAPAGAEPVDTLEAMDLSSLFDEGMDQASPEDMLRRLQAAMGLEVGGSESGPVPAADPVPRPEARHPVMAPSLEPIAPAAEAAGLEASQPAAPVATVTSEEYPSQADRLPQKPQPMGDADAVGASGWSGDEADAAELPLDFSLQIEEPFSPEPEAPATRDSAGFGFDPVAFELEELPPAPMAIEQASLDETIDLAYAEVDGPLEPSAGEIDEFDFSTYDTLPPAGTPELGKGARVETPAADDFALGGTLTLESAADDDEIARLAAALEDSPSLPSAAELPPLEFDFARPAATEAEPALARPAPAPAPAEAPAAKAAAVEPPVKSKGFGELSLQPMDEGLIDPGVKAPAAPVATFDFSHLSLSLEPIEEEAAPAVQADGREGDVPTMRDGAWLRDLGEVQPATAAQDGMPAEATATLDDDGALEQTLETGSEPSAAEPPPLPQGVLAAARRPVAPPLAGGISRVIVLCASIGGPDALRGFLSGIPAGFPALFVVVQHLENGYFERLAQQLQKSSLLPVRVPMAGLGARDGEVLVVASGARFQLAVDGQVELSEPQRVSRYRPCIDDVLQDVSEVFGPHAHAIIFSGMAADAVEGAVHLSELGGEVWAQDPETCVVSSMVDGARSRGVVEFIGSPRELAEHCVRRFGGVT